MSTKTKATGNEIPLTSSPDPPTKEETGLLEAADFSFWSNLVDNVWTCLAKASNSRCKAGDGWDAPAPAPAPTPPPTLPPYPLPPVAW